MNNHTSKTTQVLMLLFLLSVAGALIIYFAIHSPVEMDNYAGRGGEKSYPDGLDDFRRILVYSGILLTSALLALLLISAASAKESAKDKILNYFLFLLVFAIAWKSYPYWANGLHFVFSGGTSSLYDPKDLIPYVDIGIIWSVPVLFFHMLIWLIVPLPVILAVINIRKEGVNYKDALTLLIIVLLVSSFYFTPDYMYWFMD